MIGKMPRPSFSKLKYSSQLTTTFVVGIIILAVVSSLVNSWVASNDAKEQFQTQGYQLTNKFASEAKLALLVEASENAQMAVRSLLAFPDVIQVAIYNSDRSLLLKEGEHTGLIDTKWLSRPRKNARLVSESKDAWYFASKVIDIPQLDTLQSPFGEAIPEPQLLGYVAVVLSKKHLNTLLQRVFIVNLGVAFALAAGLLVVLRLITRPLTKPLERLSSIMMRAQKGETGIRAELSGPKDIVDMEQAFNQMMSVIEEYQSELEAGRDAALETAKLKAEFAAVVSHEIRTPLNGVLGMMNLLNDVGVSSKQQEYLNLAMSSGDALLDLVNNILDFSKIEAGKLVLEKAEFNLRECLESVVALFAEKARSKGIELCLDIPPDLPVIVKSDIIRLRQILYNLLSNAIKFSEQGEVLLALSVINDPSCCRFNFSVADSGVGIPPEAQKQIFESFKQGDSSTNRKYGGTGLGLTICKQLVTLLGGEISLESEAGKGSRFSFSIPLGIIKDYIPMQTFQGKTVLVLERNGHNRRYLNNTLIALGCRCRALANENDLFPGDAKGCADILLFNPNTLRSGIEPFLDRIRSAKQEIANRLVMIVEPFVGGYETTDVAAILRSPVRYEDLRNCLLEQLMNQDHASSIQKLVVEDKRPVQSNRFVLIVDDNRTNQLVAKAMLSESGYQADIASGGREAVRLVTRKAYDLLLMDCNMPEIDGFEATQKIRSLGGKASKVPILAMTATDNPVDIQRCFEVGMNGFLLKPLNLDRLRQKLNEQFSGLDTGVFEGIDSGSSFDADNLANLQKAMGNKVTEIIDAFLTDTPSYIGQLQKHLDAEDWRSVKDIAHVIKGSSRNLGANLFASVCRELEDLCIQGKQPKSRAQYLFLEMRREYEKVEAILRSKRDSLVASNKSATKPGTILVVDDDRSTRLTIVNVLASSGLHVEQAVNGREAVDFFKKNNPDLVIMDAVMPVMDGFAACREIKNAIGGIQTPVLMITALENDDSIEAAFKCGAADFIAKPINLSVLKMRVQRFLDASQSEQRVKQLAFIDGITDLPNRVAFIARLKQDIAHAKRNNNQLAILFVDIDHFKDVNDSLGHAAGDELLKKLAERVSECVRSEDTLARLGGDEFVVALGAISGPEGADTVASHILSALSSPFEISGREVFVGASIGIAIYPDDGKDRETLLKNADTAMYRAKATGRNNYQFYTLEMSTAISERIELEADLRKVLNNNELLLYYQPKVELLTGEMVGAEALVRWQHPSRGFLSPTEFISVADDVGLLNEIGSWVMTAACTQFEKWRSIKDFADGIAVNISARQLMSSGFVDDVRRCLEKSHLPARYLELEITENTILENADETIEKLKQLRGMGIKIAIDDFGVGYSSFSYLKHLPVNVLKIDRGFVQDIPDDSSANAIVNGMINLAHNLDLLVVAEGVETGAQYRFLKDHDCDVVQGYFVSEPIPAKEYFEKFIENDKIIAYQTNG